MFTPATAPTVRPPFLAASQPPLSESRPAPARLAVSALEELFTGELRVIRLGREGTCIHAVFGTGRGSALSPQERRVLRLLVSGRCQKEISYDLGVAVTTVSSHVRSGLDRLGFRCWEQAVLATALLEQSWPPGAMGTASDAKVAVGGVLVEAQGHLSSALLSRLSSAERDVALMVVDGSTNAEIAARRRTSPRTVANQIASMFHKVRVQRRLEFIRRLTSSAEDGLWPLLRSGPALG